jgi:sec-independent protein translocase protein TatA
MPTLGPVELLIILAIIIAIFGASRLAGVGAALGNSVRDFRRSVKDNDHTP